MVEEVSLVIRFLGLTYSFLGRGGFFGALGFPVSIAVKEPLLPLSFLIFLVNF